MLAYIYTANGISVLLNGVLTALAQDDPRYDPLVSALNAGESDDSVLAALIATPKAQLQAAIEAVKLSALISIAGDMVFYKERPLDNSLTRRMLEHLRQGISVAPLVPFLENLELNPSRRVEQTLYEFLEYGKIPLTTDGHFLAYKAVREDWYDIHSGSFNNAIGEIVEVERNQVDEDADRTCSYGLHVCSFEYLPHFSHAGGHVVIVKVNPRDVVAIPRDYNNTKMRVCRYEVVGEVDDYYGKRVNYLSSQAVFADWDRYPEDPVVDEPEPEPEPEPEFEVTVYERDGSVFDRSTFFDWDEAESFAESQLDFWSPVAIITGAGRELTLRA